MKKAIIMCILMLAILGQAAAEVTTVRVADSKGVKGEIVKIPIIVSNASNISAMDMAISYDSSVLRGVDAISGTIGTNTSIDSKETHPGLMRISFTDQKGISGNGVLLVVVFDVIGDTGLSTEISIDVTGYDEKSLEVPLKTLSGNLRVENASVPMSRIIITAILIIVILLILILMFKRVLINKK